MATMSYQECVAVIGPMLTWDEVRALLRRSAYTGPVIIHCAEGQPKVLEIPADPRPSQRFIIALDSAVQDVRL